MTDDWDRRLLMTILADFYNKEIIEIPHYSLSPSGKYCVPPKSSYEEYIDYIKVKSLQKGSNCINIVHVFACFVLYIDVQLRKLALFSRSFQSTSIQRCLGCMKM